MMDKNKDFQIPALSSEDIVNRLEGSSPLQACKVLLDVELHDQRDSLNILQEIEKEFEGSQAGVGESLIQPILLNVCDGFVSHPKLNLSKKGLTATRLVNELKSFSYDAKCGMDDDFRLDKARLDEHTSCQVDDKGDYNRHDLEDRLKLYEYRDRQMRGNRRTNSELEVNDKGQKRVLYKQGDEHNQRKKSKSKNYTKSSIDVDHQMPLKQMFDEYSGSKGLSLDDLKKAANQDKNLKNISAELNRSKGDKTWAQYADEVKQKRNLLERKKKKNGALSQKEQAELEKLPTEKTLENAANAGKEAKSSIEGNLNESALKNLTKDANLSKGLTKEAYMQAKGELEEKGIGELIILIIKPIFFEITDIFKNGVLHGVDTDSKLEAIGLRFNRSYEYIKDNLQNIGFDVIKDALKNFIKYLVNAIVNLFVGMLKKALQIISEGFSAIVQSVKILMSDSSSAHKADAITKLLATTVVTYVSFAFEESIAPYVEMIPVVGEYLKDATGIIVSGIGSTVVVWLLDQADLFSTKSELRTKRIKEVFEMRIQQIKANTDAFEQASIEKLAKDKLQFRILTERLAKSIEGDENVNADVEDIAEFMKVDLKIKSNDDFLALLENSNTLQIA